MATKEFLSAEDAGCNYDTTRLALEDNKYGWNLKILGGIFEYVKGPTKGRNEIAFELHISKDGTTHVFSLASVKPNSIHDKKKLDAKTFDNWAPKVFVHIDENTLAKLILMKKNGETNKLMCSTPFGCTYYGLDNFLNSHINFHFNDEYTTHDISDIKKRALGRC